MVFTWQPVQTDKWAACCGFSFATSLILLATRLHVVVFALQPVQNDLVGNCMLWFLLGNQFRLTHKEAA